LRREADSLAPGPGGARSTRRFTPIGIAALLALAAIAPAGEVASADSSGRDGGVAYYGHVFPVRGPHGTRGAIGEFGAPRDGGRTHEGFDIVAACGTPAVAVRDGRVRGAGYDPVLYGNYLLLHGEGEHRSYFYAHLRRPPAVHRGERVFAGERVGVVGKTGNARTTGCHLHFEIHVDGRPIDPEPSLRRWDRYS
jgi:murein DD-endopeptidase MepM/ murein hydrolase activator NlpD